MAPSTQGYLGSRHRLPLAAAMTWAEPEKDLREYERRAGRERGSPLRLLCLLHGLLRTLSLLSLLHEQDCGILWSQGQPLWVKNQNPIP